jgi:orotate phosphoribosyltransferase
VTGLDASGHADAAVLTAALRDVILARGYVRRDEPFRLSSGGFSNDYVDMRRALGRGEDLAVAARALLARLEVRAVGYEAIGGMTMGADPVAHAAALLGGHGWFSVRKADKAHGTGRRIEGVEITPGMPIVLVEDTISTGASMLDALVVVRAAGARVVLACALLDRGDAAAAALAAAGVAYEPLLTYADIGIEPLAASPAPTG